MVLYLKADICQQQKVKIINNSKIMCDFFLEYQRLIRSGCFGIYASILFNNDEIF